MKTTPAKLFLAAAVLVSTLNSMPRRNAVKAGQRATTWLFVLLLLAAINASLSTCFAQGSLTPPPGVPGQTMITLSQIEPRTPISSAPYSITKPGSYYLTTNLTVTVGDVIDINANGVTLDLNGFTISSTSPFDGGTAILLNVVNYNNSTGASDITISNGHITGGVTNKAGVYSGPGFNNGICYFLAPPAPPSNVRVTGATVSGCLNFGISLGTGNPTVVESCTVNTVGGGGIVASSVSHSRAVQCGSTAISADTASDCYGYSTGGDGLDASYAAENCYGTCTGSGYGLNAYNANNCYGNSIMFSYAGIDCANANNCYGHSTSGDGLDTVSANNCRGQTANGTGLSAGQITIGCLGEALISGTGLSSKIAIGCSAYSASGVGLSATIANSCLISGGTTNITYKYNMP